MSVVFFICALIAGVGVVASLFAGLISMGRGGTVNARFGNLLMRARIGLQLAAVVFLVLAAVTRGS